MLSFTVRMRFDAADHDAVAEMLRHLTLASRQEPGCVSYIAHFVDGDAGMVLIYEQYLKPRGARSSSRHTSFSSPCDRRPISDHEGSTDGDFDRRLLACNRHTAAGNASC